MERSDALRIILENWTLKEKLNDFKEKSSIELKVNVASRPGKREGKCDFKIIYQSNSY